MNALIGKNVTAVWLAEDGGAIKFDFGDGQIIARADGDCCSRTWIENVDGAEQLIGTVSAIENIPPQARTQRDDGEVIQFYGCRITTDKGFATIDYRNESNGYYGGSLEWDVENFYGGVNGQNVSKEEWRLITGETIRAATVERDMERDE